MGKITKKSVNTLMDIYKRNSVDTVLKLADPQNEDLIVMEISLKTGLTITEKGIFVDRVVIPCFDADGDFMPQYLDPLFMITLLQMTTNVPPIEDTIPIVDENGVETGEKTTIINIEKTYELCKAINLVKNATDVKYRALIDELRQMVADKLAYVKDINARKASNTLTILKESFGNPETTANFMNTLTQLSSTLESLSALSSNDNVVPMSGVVDCVSK